MLTGQTPVPSLGTTGDINVERGVEKWGQPAEPREGNVGAGRRKQVGEGGGAGSTSF